MLYFLTKQLAILDRLSCFPFVRVCTNTCVVSFFWLINFSTDGSRPLHTTHLALKSGLNITVPNYSNSALESGWCSWSHWLSGYHLATPNGKKKTKKLVRQRYWNSKRAKQMWKIRGSSDTVLIKTLLRFFLVNDSKFF